MSQPIQVNIAHQSVGISSNTFSCQFNNPVTAGSLIDVTVFMSSNFISITSVTDSLGNTYNLIGTMNTSSGGLFGQCAYFPNITGGSRLTVTAHFNNASTTIIYVVIQEIGGLVAANALDGQSNNYQNNLAGGATITSGNFSTNGDFDYVTATTIDAVNNQSSGLGSVGAGFILVLGYNPNNESLMLEYGIQKLPATVAGTFTMQILSRALTIARAYNSIVVNQGYGDTIQADYQWVSGEDTF